MIVIFRNGDLNINIKVCFDTLVLMVCIYMS